VIGVIDSESLIKIYHAALECLQSIMLFVQQNKQAMAIMQ
jgi:hypothetical protein